MKSQATVWKAPVIFMLLVGLAMIARPGFLGAEEAIAVDGQLKPYVKNGDRVAGTLNAVGSNTLARLMRLWAEGFHRRQVSVNVRVEGKGSNMAPSSLIEGTSQIAPMSRSMEPAELANFERKFGYKPIGFVVAIDALAIYVNKDNPVQGLTIPQLDAVFSKTHYAGHTDNIDLWAQVGVNDSLGAAPINLYSRDLLSGTYRFFKKHVLQNGDLKDEVHEQPGSAMVVQSVTEDIAGIGYSGIGFLTSKVRTVPLAEKEGLPFKEATQANALDGSYPLSRHLYLYVNKPPDKPLDPRVLEFLRFVYSLEGQRLVAKAGFFPLTVAMADGELKKLEEPALAYLSSGAGN